MDLHVAATLWVGVASILTLLVAILLDRGDDEATMAGVSHAAVPRNRVLAPLGLLAIATGVPPGWLGGWSWAAWTGLAIGIAATAFVLGATRLGPTFEGAAWREGDLPGAMALGRRVQRLMAIDLGAQWAIIAPMLMKPGRAAASLAAPAALNLAGAAVAPRRSSAATTQAARA